MNIPFVLQKAFEKRASLFEDLHTDCFRLFNHAGDGIPGLTIDMYGEYILVQFFEDALFEIKDALFEAIHNSFSILPMSIRGVLFKNRIKLHHSGEIAHFRRSELISGIIPPVGHSVVQNGCRSYVDLLEGQNTGIFLDMREIRDRLASFYISIESMLNLFSYTCLFSVHALMNGAGKAVNVDSSKAVLNRGISNYRLNDLPVDDRDFIHADAGRIIRQFDRKGRSFSFVIFDPPTFSRNKKNTFSVKKNFYENLQGIGRLANKGYVLTSVNSLQVSREEFISYHPSRWEPVFLANESSDFPYAGVPFLKVGLWKCK